MMRKVKKGQKKTEEMKEEEHKEGMDKKNIDSCLQICGDKPLLIGPLCSW